MKRTISVIVSVLVILSIFFTSSAVIAQSGPNDVADVSIQSSSITWTPKVDGIKGSTLTIAGPDNFYFRKDYAGSARPSISSGNLKDGLYTYDLVLWPNVKASQGDQSERGLKTQSQDAMKKSGAFTVRNGAFVTAAKEPAQSGGANTQGGASIQDVVHADDLIVQGSGCFGFDCVNNESFGFDTIRLKENNLRIGFSDTSVGTFPSNDWQITANDSASGGASFLAFDDITGAKTPFKVMAGAPTNSLFVSSNGDIGVRTSTPVLDFHASTSDTPGVRLEQTNAGGFTAQTWDMAGNEANFFVRDVTGGSLLPFRIRPGAPTSSIDIAANGNVGIGTSTPTDFDLEVENVAAPATFGLIDTTGSTVFLGAGATQAVFGSKNNFPLNFFVNNVQRMSLDTSGAMTVSGPVNATAFNVTSDKNVKENFAAVDQKTVLERLSTIPISTWNFIENDNKTRHMGPMAQDFYAAFGLGGDDKHISTVDADGVALAAIQELNKRNQALSSENAALHSQVDNLATRVSALESGGTPSGSSLQNWMIVLLACMNLGLIVFLVWAIRRGSFLGVRPGNE